MNFFTDTHTHFAAPEFQAQFSKQYQEAKAAGIHRFILPSTGSHDWQAIIQQQSEEMLIALGIHPWFIPKQAKQDLELLNHLLQQHPQSLLGECGLDYHKAQQHNERLLQQQLFTQQVELAQIHHRPLILHCVKAANDVINTLKQTAFTYGGFAHAFSGSLEEARLFTRLGFKIGVGVTLLNPKAKKIRQIVSTLPLSDLVLETDSPYMLPNNRPALILDIAHAVCTLRGIELNELMQQTENNIAEILARLPN